MNNSDFFIILDKFKEEINKKIDLISTTGDISAFETPQIRIKAPIEIQAAFTDFDTPYLKVEYFASTNCAETFKEIGVLKLENNETYLELFIQEIKLHNSKDSNFYMKFGLIYDWSDFWRELSEKYKTFDQHIHHIIFNEDYSNEMLAQKLASLAQENELNLIFFKKYINTLTNKGLKISFEESHPLNNMLFPVVTNSGLHFVSFNNAQIQNYRNNIINIFTSFHHSSDILEWISQKVKKADSTLILKLDNNQHLIFHMNDFFKSEDFPKIKKYLKKISLENMLERSSFWLKEISKRQYKENPEDVVKLFKTDIYTFVKLLTPNALDREGALLSHCIGRGGYDNFLLDRSRDFYSMRNNQNESIVTIEYDPKRRFIIQVQAYRNTCPLPDMAPHIQKFLKFLFPDQKVGFYNSTIANILGYEQVQIHSISPGQTHPGFLIYTRGQEKDFKHFPLMNPLGQEFSVYNRYLEANTNERLKGLVQEHIKPQLFNKKYYPLEIINLKNDILKEYNIAKKILSKYNIQFQIKKFFNSDKENYFLQHSFLNIKKYIENRDLQHSNREKILLKNKNNKWSEHELKEDLTYLTMILNISNLINKQINISIPKNFIPIQTIHIEGYIGNNNFIKEFYVDLPKRLRESQMIESKEN